MLKATLPLGVFDGSSAQGRHPPQAVEKVVVDAAGGTLLDSSCSLSELASGTLHPSARHWSARIWSGPGVHLESDLLTPPVQGVLS